jgi:hypothetical protein
MSVPEPNWPPGPPVDERTQPDRPRAKPIASAPTLLP